MNATAQLTLEGSADTTLPRTMGEGPRRPSLDPDRTGISSVGPRHEGARFVLHSRGASGEVHCGVIAPSYEVVSCEHSSHRTRRCNTVCIKLDGVWVELDGPELENARHTASLLAAARKMGSLLFAFTDREAGCRTVSGMLPARFALTGSTTEFPVGSETIACEPAGSTNYLPWTEVLARLEKYERLEPDWDSYEAERISSRAISRTKRLLGYLRSFGEEYLPPDMGPVADGGIELSWEKGPRDLYVEVGPTGTITSLLVDRTGGVRRSWPKNDVSDPDVRNLIETLLD